MRRAPHATLQRSGSHAQEARGIDRTLEDMRSGGGGHVTPRILGAATSMGYTAALR